MEAGVIMLIWIIHVNKHITDICDDVACQNGGICKVTNGKPFCQCATEFVGDYCDKREYATKSNMSFI